MIRADRARVVSFAGGSAIPPAVGRRPRPKISRIDSGSRNRTGNRDKKERRIKPAPMQPITSKINIRNCGSKDKPKLKSVNSITISTSPRRRSQRRAVRGSGLAFIASAAEAPARKTKAGAQKWVIHRVKKSNGVVTARSVGVLVRDQP
jgi:hypothetical protein